MLHHLLKFSQESEPGFSAKSIRWQIELSEDGSLLGVTPLGDPKRGLLHRKVPVMHNMGAGGRSHFLVESVGVVALFLANDDDKKVGDNTERRRRFFIDLLKEPSREDPDLGVIAAFLESGEKSESLRVTFEQKGAKPAHLAKFTVDGRDPLVKPAVLAWWRSWRERDLAAGNAEVGADMVDMLTGHAVSPAATHPKVMGLGRVGGLATGDVVAGFDKKAFQSFGLSQSCNSAMSEETARGYVDALNDLVRQAKPLAGALVAHWFKEKLQATEDDALAWIIEPPEAQAASAAARAKGLLDSIRDGRRPDLAGNAYYALTLSGASGRVMVRDWMEGSFPDLVANAHRWFEDMEIAGLEGGMAKDRKFEAVLTSLLKPKPRGQDYPDWVRPLGGMRAALYRCAVVGRPIPREAMAKLAALLPAFLAGKDLREALSRKAKQGQDSGGPTISTLFARIGLVKAYFIRKEVTGMTACLNMEHPDPAYHCGRLLAALSGLQKAALGDVGASVVQRYYAGAAQRPGLVFGDLVRNSKNHLHKLSPGLAHWHEDRLAEIVARLKEFPRTLNLEEQTMFALGYYHQLAHDRAGKSRETAASAKEA
ncbi:MAG: type I-C CRISPR-associated protein Cas8c/Csd1 [Elusimicrobia bacterium]|nr:type I-C CRISPR-associated protein Cas8c/Csd1 [Elusimicrobiota bacterium]